MLAIDDVHMEFESMVRMRKALERFLEEDLRDEDQVALVTTSGTSALSQEFTNDRAALLRVLSRLSPQGRRVDWASVPRITDYQAELIEGGDVMALDAAVQEILQEGLIQDAGTAEQMARHKARAVLAEAVANSRLTLEVLESLCRGLSGLTGRKALFFVSDGFLTGLSARSGSGFDIRRIADAGTRAGVVVYALDTRALLASAPAMSASSITRPMPMTLGTIEAMRSRSVEATRDAMHALAADTGGFLVENSNNLRAGLRQLLKDTETYYVLAYEPANTKRDGSFRKVEVRLPGVQGVKIRTRSGYFAPDERRDAADQAGEAAVRQAEQRRAEMRLALGSLAPLTAIPVRFAADFVHLDGASQVMVSAAVDVSTIPYVRRGDRREATVETGGLVLDEAGRVALALDTERSVMGLNDADHARLLRHGLPYTRAVVLPPGQYQVRLAVRDEATGLLGSAWRRVEVPDLAQDRLALSGLFLLKDEGAALAELPAQPGAAPTLHSVQALPRFTRSENLYAQVHAYNPKRNAAGAADLVAQAAVLRGGAVLATAAPEAMAEGETPKSVSHVSRIGLRQFEPGDYELRVTVTDRNANAIIARSVGFTVE